MLGIQLFGWMSPPTGSSLSTEETPCSPVAPKPSKKTAAPLGARSEFFVLPEAPAFSRPSLHGSSLQQALRRFENTAIPHPRKPSSEKLEKRFKNPTPLEIAAQIEREFSSSRHRELLVLNSNPTQCYRSQRTRPRRPLSNLQGSDLFEYRILRSTPN